MQLNTIQRRKARGAFGEALGKEELVNRMYQIMKIGKQGLDGFVQELGTLLVEAIMDMEREERSGPEYHPSQEDLYKWAYQDGSVYLGDQKISVRHPRLRGPGGEVPLQSYEALKKPGGSRKRFWTRCCGGSLLGSIKRPCWRRVMPLGFPPVRGHGIWWRERLGSSRSSRSVTFRRLLPLPFLSTPFIVEERPS